MSVACPRCQSLDVAREVAPDGGMARGWCNRCKVSWRPDYEWLVWISLPGMTFSLGVGGDGVVKWSAPVAKWAVGRRGREVLNNFLGRGARVALKRGDEPWRELAPRAKAES